MAATGALLRRAAIRELARRERRAAARPHPIDVDKICHPKQAKLVNALVLGPLRNISALAGRQSGKSHGGAALAPLLLLQRTPGVNAIVVTATEASCEKMAFLPAVALNRTLGLGGTPHFAKGDLKIAFPNGSVVYYLGANHAATIDRLRGTPNLVLCVIDEAGIYDTETLAKMIKAVRPGLRPRRGKLCVMGTPSLAGKQGTWWDITENPQYDQHRFDYVDHAEGLGLDLADVEKTIDEDLLAQFPTMTPIEARLTAWFLREYKAQFEVDLAEKVYQLTNDNLVDKIPGPFALCCTAGDLGVSAHDSLVCAGWNENSGAVYVQDQKQVSGQDTLDYAAMVKAHYKEREPLAVVVDAGGLGQKTIRTVKKMHPTIPIEEAVKPPIPLQVRALNELLQGAHGWRLYLLRGSPLALDLARPTWVDGLIGGEIDEHGHHSDLVPPARYLAIKIRQFLTELAAPLTEEEKRREKYLAGIKRAVDNAKRQARRQGADSGYDADEFDSDLSLDLDGDDMP